jgi:putative oxidoreductase
MARSGSRTMSIITMVLGVVMSISGITKLIGEAHQVAMFTLVGLPHWFLMLVGTFELVGGILLLVPRTTPVGSLILATIMIGALWAHVAQGEWVNLVPVTVLLTVFLLVFRSSRTRAVQLLGGVS